LENKVKYTFLLALICFSSYQLFSQDNRLVCVAAFNYYPAIFQDTDGAVKGFYVDILDELGKNGSMAQ